MNDLLKCFGRITGEQREYEMTNICTIRAPSDGFLTIGCLDRMNQQRSAI